MQEELRVEGTARSCEYTDLGVRAPLLRPRFGSQCPSFPADVGDPGSALFKGQEPWLLGLGCRAHGHAT